MDHVCIMYMKINLFFPKTKKDKNLKASVLLFSYSLSQPGKSHIRMLYIRVESSIISRAKHRCKIQVPNSFPALFFAPSTHVSDEFRSLQVAYKWFLGLNLLTQNHRLLYPNGVSPPRNMPQRWMEVGEGKNSNSNVCQPQSPGRSRVKQDQVFPKEPNLPSNHPSSKI